MNPAEEQNQEEEGVGQAVAKRDDFEAQMALLEN
jgi:hypothetical protein